MSETTPHPDLTIAEIAARHKLSRQVVTRLFENERGIIIVSVGSGKLRRHRTIRIPYPVYQRVLLRITKSMRRGPRKTIKKLG